MKPSEGVEFAFGRMAQEFWKARQALDDDEYQKFLGVVADLIVSEKAYCMEELGWEPVGGRGLWTHPDHEGAFTFSEAIRAMGDVT